MATNWGDGILAALRARIISVSGVPATQLWQNQTGEPVPGIDFLDDAMITLDTVRREVGPNAYGRTVGMYRVTVNVNALSGALPAWALVASITDALHSVGQSFMTVNGFTVIVTTIRSGPASPTTKTSQWFTIPVFVMFSLDHA